MASSWIFEMLKFVELFTGAALGLMALCKALTNK